MADENVKTEEEKVSSEISAKIEDDKKAEGTKPTEESKDEKPAAFAGFKVPAPFKKPAAFAPKKLSSPKPAHPPPQLATEVFPQKVAGKVGGSDDLSEKLQSEPQDKGPTRTKDVVKIEGSADESKDSEDAVQINGDRQKQQHLKESPPKKKQSPAENLQAPPLPYKEPTWSAVPDKPYCLEVLKNGCIVSKIELTGKPFYVFGRLDGCDVTLEHPSLSRYHAVVQFRGEGDGERERGFYLYDLGSTHGTWMNKMEVKPKVYYRLRVGYMIKFGGSSRMYILQGPDEDQEDESEMTATELRDLHRQEREKAEQADTDDVNESRETYEEEMEEFRRKKKKEKDVEEEGISWGMEDDAEEEEDEMNPFSLELTEEKEAYYVKDPKKALKNFFEREGEELEYEVEEKGTSFHRQFYCRVRLPVEGPDGREQYAEATTSGKKKEAVLACALEACRLLDAYGVLRQQGYKSKRVTRNWEENDYYDSDEDTFTDRTGDVEKKRIRRMKKAGKDDNVTHTYDSLSSQHEEVLKELRTTEEKLAAARRKSDSEESEDPLEAFMSNMAAGSGLSKVEVSKLRLRLFELRKEEQRLQRLMKVAKPADLPQLSTSPSGAPGEPSAGVATKKQPWRNLPLTGAMKGRHMAARSKPQPAMPKPVQVPSTVDQEEEEEEEEEELEERKEEAVAMETEQVTASDLQTNMAAPEEPQEEEEQPRATGTDIVTSKSPVKRPLEGDVTEDQGEDQSAEGEEFVDPKPQVSKKKKKSQTKPSPPLSKQYADDDPDYSMWVPPENQSGDGKTSLNEKYGY